MIVKYFPKPITTIVLALIVCGYVSSCANQSPATKEEFPHTKEAVAARKLDEALGSYAKIINSLEGDSLSLSEAKNQMNDADFKLDDAVLNIEAQIGTNRFGDIDFSEEKQNLRMLFRWWARFAEASKYEEASKSSVHLTCFKIRCVPSLPKLSTGKGGLPKLKSFKGGFWDDQDIWSVQESINLIKFLPDLNLLGYLDDKKYLIINAKTNPELMRALRNYECSSNEPFDFFEVISPLTTKIAFQQNFSQKEFTELSKKLEIPSDPEMVGVKFYDLTLYFESKRSRNEVFKFLKKRVNDIRLIVKAEVSRMQSANTTYKISR